MSQEPTPSPAPSPPQDSILSNPTAQAALSGAVTLIPARNYPGWLRGVMSWVPALAVSGVAMAPGATSGIIKKLQEREGTPTDTELPEPSPVVRAGLAAGLGALVYGSVRLSFLLDEAADRGLRKLRVPFPRVVMGAAVAAGAYRSAVTENQRREARRAEAAAAKGAQQNSTPSPATSGSESSSA
ncbi:hypothetical protein HGQ17_13105 [Nesterenkonia sp. MY13]|uniref:Uncharacterized protein n=1 Tax=Nesterenkonia sedimenti TaxID=1463632 RepID=A0A7X8YEK0_9MICC|nr:hypothetical protein [Nesterenkonia sedimenti]NLS10913.1 hypothetical protein [Nesterenkonia sedimenti]